MMLTDTEIEVAGFRALVEGLGDVKAEKFIALAQREPFDYTRRLPARWADKSVEEISQVAMKQRRADQPPGN
jgi:hypothetical protein